MKQIPRALVMVGTLVVFGSMATMAALAHDRAHELKLQQAIDLVESKGDLAKATPLLEEIAASPDRALAARALLYLAQAQAAQNKEKARATYQRIIEQFSDQTDVVARAKASSATLTPVKRQTDELSPPRVVALGFAATDVSPDGRMAVGPCTDPQSICLREIESGQMRTLVSGTDTGSVVRAIISPTSRDVAYAWTEKVDGKDRFSIRLIGTDKNAQPRTLTSSEGILSPADWSPDGKALLLVVVQGPRRSMTWMNVSDGSTRPIKSFENWRTPRAGQVSPDGNFISFEDLAREGSSDWYIYIMDRDGQHEEAVVKMAGMSGSAKWTPDAAHLVFRSNRSGRPALWSVPVDRGRAVGEPKLLQIEGPVSPIVITGFRRVVLPPGGHQESVPAGVRCRADDVRHARSSSRSPAKACHGRRMASRSPICETTRPEWL